MAECNDYPADYGSTNTHADRLEESFELCGSTPTKINHKVNHDPKWLLYTYIQIYIQLQDTKTFSKYYVYIGIGMTNLCARSQAYSYLTTEYYVSI